MMLRNDTVTLQGRDGTVEIKRNTYSIPEISAQSYRDCSLGLGWIHANDRQLRMMLSRIILEGRSAEFINASRELVEADRHIRSLNLYPDIDRQKQFLERDVRESLDLYSEGVNTFLEKEGISHDLKSLKFSPEPWKTEDTMRLAKILFTFRMLESQSGFRKLIIKMIREGLDEKKLRELFPPITESVDVELLKKVRISPPPSPQTLHWLSIIPAFFSGSAWAVSGRNTVTGKPLLCADSILEINRTPSLWHEVILRMPDNNITGFTIPGIPFVFSGRNSHIAFSGINSSSDMTAIRIEECGNGKFRRGSTWHHFNVRREYIKTKNGGIIKADFFENEHGVLEGNPFIDGFYLVREWSAWKNCGARELNVFFNVMRSKTVREAMKHYRELDSVPFNYVIADSAGNIGGQMSGRLFNRPPGISGLIPLPAWDKKYDNKGFLLKNRLGSVYNPVSGMVIAADNNFINTEERDRDKPGVPHYRYERIRQMLKNRKKTDTEYMKEIQYDLCSLQPESFMKILFPLADFKRRGRLLKEWDMGYRPDSEGATVFENIYESMIVNLFAVNALGMDALKQFFNDPYIYNRCYGIFDSILLNKQSSWFQSGSWHEFFETAARIGLKKKSARYGNKRTIRFNRLLSDNRFFFTHGNKSLYAELTGSRATINHCLLFKSNGSDIAAGPSFRIITDMADDFLLSNAAGDNCDRPFTGMYKNNIKDWLKGIYKKLS
jgi:penicillin amidase